MKTVLIILGILLLIFAVVQIFAIIFSGDRGAFHFGYRLQGRRRHWGSWYYFLFSKKTLIKTCFQCQINMFFAEIFI